MVEYIAIIPARGGSKELPGKNIKKINNKALIEYTIDAALSCKFIDRVICSTDDKDIAKIAVNVGAEIPFIRPSKLSSDIAHTPPVIEHALSFLEKKESLNIKNVITLQPTSPLRNFLHIEKAVIEFSKKKFDSLISVKHGFPPWWAFTAKKDKLEPFVKLDEGQNAYNLERQQLPQVLEANGAIYITDRHYLKSYGCLINPNNCGYLLMDQKSSLDVDNLTDFMLCELVMKQQE
jgi:CMP-N,N'-diacetyllegionaminic acid synthase